MKNTLLVICLLGLSVVYAADAAGKAEEAPPAKAAEAPAEAAADAAAKAVAAPVAADTSAMMAAQAAAAAAVTAPPTPNPLEALNRGVSGGHKTGTRTVQCFYDIKVTTSTNIPIGNEGWWPKQYVVLENLANSCSQPETRVSLNIPELGHNLLVPTVNVKNNSTVKYVMGEDKVPQIFIPIMDVDVENIPKRGRFGAVMQCKQPWFEQEIDLKQCLLVLTQEEKEDRNNFLEEAEDEDDFDLYDGDEDFDEE